MPTIQLKRLGKKKIKEFSFDLVMPVSNLRTLIESCVKSEVNHFNQKKQDALLIPFLSKDQIQQQSTDGKVSFGDSLNNTQAIEKEVIENAIQGFEDGLFAVFINDDEITDLQQTLEINEDNIISFIRMTFLSGSYW